MAKAGTETGFDFTPDRGNNRHTGPEAASESDTSPHHPQTVDAYLSDRELAERTGTRPQTWRKWRLQGRGPRYVKIGRLVRYRWRDVQAWLDSRTVENTAQSG